MQRTHKKRRTKTFTGCWTCRGRHLKCDEARPGCHRCSSASLTCEGYGIRLSWGPAHTSASFQQPENPDKITNQSPHSASETPISSSRDQNENEIVHLNDQEKSQPRTCSALAQAIDLPDQRTPRNDDSLHLISPSIPTQFRGHDGSDIDDPQIQFSEALRDFEENLTREFNLADHPCIPPVLETSSQSNACAMRERDQDHCSNESIPGNSSDLPLASPAPLRHLDTLPDLPYQRQLLEHWMLHLVDSILPIPSHDNPLRWLITPIALYGARERSGSFSPSTALFHLICSASGSQLYRLNGIDKFKNLSISHQRVGLRHLRQSIFRQDEKQYLPLIAALSMCLIHETLTLGTPFWRLHSRGACSWIRRVPYSFWMQSKALSTAYQIFAGLICMIQLQVVFIEDEDTYGSLIEFNDPGDYYCMDKIYGLSHSTFNALMSLTNFQLRSRNQLSSSPRDLDLLEMELYLSAPSYPNDGHDEEVKCMTYHQSYMFYYASLILLRRSLRGVGASDVEILVERVFDHLDEMMKCTQRIFSPCVWPVAVASFETISSTLHNRSLRLLDFLTQRTHFDVWSGVRNLAIDVWNTRHASIGGSPVSDLCWQKIWLQLKTDGSPEILLA
ncbi:hypothetical protein N7456_004932 [Penicillium angulare]|uniref:Zn(2)-C6 fungal-type domain-containing protein n=1 Tax=Penicillium angulare TaxID=116970 RepID=A0A9W9KK35_9EURO|nr:hypothetical protein N7456_004932 [Penicillium angulare]